MSNPKSILLIIPESRYREFLTSPFEDGNPPQTAGMTERGWSCPTAVIEKPSSCSPESPRLQPARMTKQFVHQNLTWGHEGSPTNRLFPLPSRRRSTGTSLQKRNRRDAPANYFSSCRDVSVRRLSPMTLNCQSMEGMDERCQSIDGKSTFNL